MFERRFEFSRTRPKGSIFCVYLIISLGCTIKSSYNCPEYLRLILGCLLDNRLK